MKEIWGRFGRKMGLSQLTVALRADLPCLGETATLLAARGTGAARATLLVLLNFYAAPLPIINL